MKSAWWRKQGAMFRFTPIAAGKSLNELAEKLPALADAGIGVIEILPPCHGGSEYFGLDTIDFYQVHPGAGTLDDMRAFIAAAHRLGMKIIACVNAGYCAVNHPDFIKACGDVKNGRESRERNFFLWSDEKRRMEAPLSPFFLQDADGEWVYNGEAEKYFWCKWFGFKGDVRLPQYWFGSREFQDECKKMIRYWLTIGFDGLMLDAVNWYIDCDWDINRRVIVEPAFSDGPVWLMPEGGGGFNDDPLEWITKGGYNCVQDYSLGIWWEKTDLIHEALETGDASKIPPALMRCRNRVVEAGGVTYVGKEMRPDYAVFETAFLIAAGEMISYYHDGVDADFPEGVSTLFRLQAEYPALAPGGRREFLEHDCGGGVLAFRCIPEDGGGTIVHAVLNFSAQARAVNIAGVPQCRELGGRSFVFTKEPGEVIFAGQ
ncbi:MAG: hypothetical protein LBD37_09200 [Treponema sp.]|jgi:hypothetical protein|nr:hypothetical protein [Treponema sp.]